MDIRTLFSFFLIVAFSFCNLCHAMEKESDHVEKIRPLNWIEREIFITHIQQPHGMHLIEKELNIMQIVKDYKIIIDLNIYPDHKNNALAKMIYEAIKIKEKKEPYRTKTILDQNGNTCH